jgi:catechol 2,3-dioxygenase-like lactoylglutathione lyase family enzyme
MATPKIRHLAIFARDPAKMARYYQTVFDMKLVHTAGEACFVSDGYLTMAILKHRLDGSAPVGLNHFGFVVDSNDEIMRRTAEFGLEAPKKRPADRPFAEFRACDPEGNFFDVSQHGYDVVETEQDRTKRKEPA